jgi:hypothetical protein
MMPKTENLSYDLGKPVRVMYQVVFSHEALPTLRRCTVAGEIIIDSTLAATFLDTKESTLFVSFIRKGGAIDTEEY